MIDLENIERLANIAQLELTDAEKEYYHRKLNHLLQRVQCIQEPDTRQIVPTTHVLAAGNVLREDKVGEHLGIDQALANAAAVSDSYFLVPKII